MEKLRSALVFGGILSNENREALLTHFNKRALKSNEHFHYMGKIAHEVAFVEHGLLRVYAAEYNGNEVTKYFIKENQFVVDLESYYTDTPSKDALQAVVPSEIYTLHKLAIDELCGQMPNLYIFIKSITEAQLLNKRQ